MKTIWQKLAVAIAEKRESFSSGRFIIMMLLLLSFFSASLYVFISSLTD